VKLRIIRDILTIGGFLILLLNFGKIRSMVSTERVKTAFIEALDCASDDIISFDEP